MFFIVPLPERSYKYRNRGKSLTECENGKYHKVSVVLLRRGLWSVRTKATVYPLRFGQYVSLSAIFTE